MRRRLGIHGATDETLRLIGQLTGSPRVEVVRVFDPDAAGAVERADALGPELRDLLLLVATDDFNTFCGSDDLSIVVDASRNGDFQRRQPEAAQRGVQVVTPRAARLLWGRDLNAQDRKAELLQVLSQLVESVELSVDSDELFTRMLEIAIDVTGANGGSLMLLEPGSQDLRIRVAVGVEPELWAKIRVPIGEGVAGRAAAQRTALRIDGRADSERFQGARGRLDVESAICVPLICDERLLGVLNLHHSGMRSAFDDEDLCFVQQLADLDAQIIARAEEQASLREQAARYAAVREVQAILAHPRPLPDRLRELCQFVATRAGRGVASLYLRDDNADEMRLAASSLDGAGYPVEVRLRLGAGIDGQVAELGEAAFLLGEVEGLEYASLPLCVNDDVFGVLAIQASSGSASTRAGRDMLLEIASSIARVLAQAGREERISERANRLSAINETGIRMLAASELEEVASLATSSLSMILGAEHVVLRLQDEESKRFTIRSYFGPAEGEQQERLFVLDKHVSVRAIQDNRPELVADVSEQAEIAPLAAGCRSLITSPLRQDGRVVGTLAAYDKIEGARFLAGHFDQDDLEVFSRFVSYVERAATHARDRSLARQQRNFDPETGLPNENYLDRRVLEEIARAEGRQAAMALCVCTIENLSEIAQSDGPAVARATVRRVAEALRSSLRDFDVLGRRSEQGFEILLPDPGDSPGDRIYSLARAVTDRVCKDTSAVGQERVSLGFGYAIHPYHGADRATLLAAATPPRIRMV